MEFTEQQRLAIERREGELLLDAGAGSGKTSVLVERFARAVAQDGIAVGQILTITFTEKAAAELRERIRVRLRASGDRAAADAAEGAWISTIHALCARLLRTHALEAGLDPEFSVLDELDAAPLRRAAFDAALAASARTEAGAELIAAHGPVALRSAITATYAELRARGARDPGLPAAPAPPPALDLRAARLSVDRLGAALQRELAAIDRPGRRVRDALALLARVPDVLARVPDGLARVPDGLARVPDVLARVPDVLARVPDALARVPDVLAAEAPWPGDLERLRLGDGAAALRSQACEDYRGALEELHELAARTWAVPARDALDALLREFAARYAALKRERSGLDFADLELLARELLSSPEVAGRYRERFVAVMVDEMQDTNRVQLELIELIAGPDLFMVGDAQQSIYGFRHADVELFEERGLRLERDGRRASLQTNFRSQPEILTALNGAFGQALGGGFRPLLPGRTQEPAAEPLVELLIADKDSFATGPEPLIEPLAAPWRVAEAGALAARIRELIGAGRARPGEVVVLLRATTDMHVYERALEREGVPTYVIGGRGYWSHPQVLELLAYLRALANPLDAEALYAVLLSPLCGLSLDGLVLEHADASEQLGAADRVRREEFRAWFAKERRAAAWLGAEQLLDRALAHNGYELRAAGAADGRRRLANVRKLLRLAREWQAQHGSDLRGFVDLVETRADEGEGARESEAPVESEALDAVRLMTIHRAKGLEFPVVCVADLGRQVQPRPGALVRVGRDGQSLGLRLKRPGEAQRVNVLAYDRLKAAERERELAEERRLFYVAMTRARERLIVSGAAKLGAWDDGNRLAPIGWVGAAFVPDIAPRAATAAAAFAAAATAPVAGASRGVGRSEFVTELGVRVSFLSATATAAGPAPARPRPAASARRPAPPAPAVAAPTVATPVAPAHTAPAPTVTTRTAPPPTAPAPTVTTRTAPPPAAPPPAAPPPAIPPLSYTALATYEQCGYRFYVQRVLGLPEAPTPAPAAPTPASAAGAPASAAGAPQPPARPPLTAAERGTLIHELLARIDLRRPVLPDPLPVDVRDLLTGLFGSSTFARVAALREVHREQSFAFPVGETPVTGVFDVLAREAHGDHMLVVDYKSDSLSGVTPANVMRERYGGQRTIYALAALALGAVAVEVVHLFLEAPEEPVSARFGAADVPALEAELVRRVAGPLAGDFAVTRAPGRRVCDGCPAQGGLCSYPLALTGR